MKIIQDINPYLPDTQNINPSKEGGHGRIFYPGETDNIIWQTRSRLSDDFEQTLIRQLEIIFDNGITELIDIVNKLNEQRYFDRSQQPWTAESFCEYLAINGY